MVDSKLNLTFAETWISMQNLKKLHIIGCLDGRKKQKQTEISNNIKPPENFENATIQHQTTQKQKWV